MCILLLHALTPIPEEPRCPFSSSIPPLLMIPLHPTLDHTPSVTSLTSILPATQPLLVCFPWPRNTSALHSLCLPPYCFFLFIVKLHKMSLLFLSFITWFIWLLGFLCCRPLSFPVIPLLPSLPRLCSSCILYWVEQSHHQPSQLPKMKPSSHLDFLPITSCGQSVTSGFYPLNIGQVHPFPFPWQPNHSRLLPSLLEPQYILAPHH